MKYIGNVQSQANAEVYAVATGALPDGKPVIVNSNGTVSVIAVTPDTFNSVAAVNSDSFGRTATTFDSNSNRIVIAYGDGADSNKGKAIVGTVASGTISFGTPVVFNNAGTGTNFNDITATFDSNEKKVVIAYRDSDNSDYGTAIVGTVDSSDNSISFGSEAVFSSALTSNLSSTFDTSNNRVVISYRGDNDDGYAIVGAVGGTAIYFFSSAAEFSGNNNIEYTATTFDSNSNKVVIAYNDDGNSGRGTAVVGTVSGTSISFGSVVVFSGTNVATYEGITFDTSSNKVVISYRDESTDYGTAVVGTVSGTSISFGTPVVFRSANSSSMTNGTVFDTATGKVVINYFQANHGEMIVGTVSGTSISFGDSQDTGVYYNISAVYDSTSNAVVIATRGDVGGSIVAKVVVFTPAGTSLTTENFLGFTGGDVTFVNQAIGSEVQFASGIEYPASTFDSNSNKIVIAYADIADSYKGKALVGTVNSSNNSISFGSATIFETGNTQQISNVSFDSNSNRVVVAYNDAGNSNRGTAVVGSVSGTSISFGTPVVFENATTNYLTTTFDSNSNKVIIAYSNGGDSGYGTAIVGTVDSSDNSISFGTATVFESADTAGTNATFDSSSNKVLVSYIDQGNSLYGTSVVGTVSGTSISFGSAVLFKADRVTDIYSAFDTNSNKVVIAYQDRNATGSVTQYGAAVVGTISGTSISFAQ